MLKMRIKTENVMNGICFYHHKKEMGNFTEIDLTVTIVIDIWREHV
jgi:hypothetical protein